MATPSTLHCPGSVAPLELHRRLCWKEGHRHERARSEEQRLEVLDPPVAKLLVKLFPWQRLRTKC